MNKQTTLILISSAVVIATATFLVSQQKQQEVTQGDANTAAQLCTATYEGTTLTTQAAYPCAWSFCVVGDNDEAEAIPFMTIQSQADCTVGLLTRTGPEGRISDVDIDFTYFRMRDSTFEEWVGQRQVDLERGGLQFTKNASDGVLTLEAVDYEHLFDSGTLYYLEKQYSVYGDIVLEAAVYLPEEKRAALQETARDILKSTATRTE